ncbi:MAG TPA: isoprenylcysteine carboxylmethyltransferase family protein [Nitrospirota bacterium]
MKPAIIAGAAFLAFALLHSITVSRRFKSAVASIAGGERMRAYYRLAFTAISILTASAAYYVYSLQPDTFLYRPGWYILWPAHIVQFLGVWLIVAAMRPFDTGSFTGVRQASDYIRTGRTGGDIEGMKSGPLVTTGAYGLVRHPMYTAGIMMLVFEPNVTVNCLALRVLGTAYFVWGGFIEERRFASGFGPEYGEYQQRVPMFNIVKGLACWYRGHE